MMRSNWLWLGTIGLLSACGGSEFTTLAGGAGGASSGGSSGTTGDTTGTTGTSVVATSATSGAGGTTTGGSGGAATTSATGAGGTTTVGSTSAGGSTGSGGAGGKTGSGGKGGGSSGPGAGGQGGVTGSGGSAGTGGRDAGGSDGSVDCTTLRSDVAKALIDAQMCDPKAMVAQCQDVLEGICCHAPVASKDSAASIIYLKALDRYNSANCMTACTSALCPTGMSSCMANPDGGGKCTFGILPTGP